MRTWADTVVVWLVIVAGGSSAAIRAHAQQIAEPPSCEGEACGAGRAAGVSPGVDTVPPPQQASVVLREPAAPSVSSAAAHVPEEEWYGWQTLLVDLGSIGMLVVDADEVKTLGLVGLGIGGPTVHFAHGNLQIGLLSFGLRGVSLGAILIGASEINFLDGSGNEGAAGLMIAGAAGLLGTIIVDIAVFSYDDAPPQEEVRIGLTPFVDPRAESAGLYARVQL